MARIAIDGRELGGTGTGRYLERLFYYLQELDHQNEYILLLRPSVFDSWSPSAKNFAKVKCPYKEFTFAEQLGLLRQIRNLKPDLVHFPMVQQPILYRGKTVTTINDLTTIRFRNTAKNWLIFTLKREVYRAVNFIVARKADALMVFTEFVKHDFAKFTHIKDSKIVVAPLAAEELEGRPEPLAQLQGKDFIMYTGRPQPHKNLRRLIQAFGNLHGKNPGLYLLIAGKKDKSYDSYIRLVQKLGLGEHVIFSDYISDSQLKWAFGHTKAYVFPSLSEGFGLPGLEAMHYGAPVLSSNATCLPEAYQDAAHYFDPTDVNDMASKIEDVLANVDLRKELAEKGKKQVKKYSWARMAEQTLQVYTKVLKEK